MFVAQYLFSIFGKHCFCLSLHTKNDTDDEDDEVDNYDTATICISVLKLLTATNSLDNTFFVLFLDSLSEIMLTDFK